MTTMWMIRGDAGRLYDEFRDKGVAAIGWAQIAAKAKPGVSRQALTQAFQEAEPGMS